MAGKVCTAFASPSGTTISVFLGLIYDAMVRRCADTDFRFFTPPTCQKALGDCHYGLLTGYPPAPVTEEVTFTFERKVRAFLRSRSQTFEVSIVPVDLSIRDSYIVYERNCKLVFILLDANEKDPSASDRSIRQLMNDIPRSSRTEIAMLDLTRDDPVPPSAFSPDMEDRDHIYIRLKGEKDRSGNLRPTLGEEVSRELIYDGGIDRLIDLLLDLGKIDNRYRHS